MKRFKNLLNYALNCILKYKLRTAVILICLVVASSTFSAVAFLSDGLVNEGALSLKYAPDITVQGIQSGRQTLIPTSYVSYIKSSAPYVARVTERVWGYGNVGNTLIVVVGIDLSGSAIVGQEGAYPIESGSFLNGQSNQSIVIGKGVAELLGASVGSELSIVTEANKIKKYEITGIFNSESGIYNADMILMNLNTARDFFNVPQDKATDLMVYVTPANESVRGVMINEAARAISALSNCRVLTKDMLTNAQEKTYGDKSGFFSIVWYVILIAVAIIAFNQTVVVGHESKFEVGLLKALGFSTSDVIQVRIIEGLVLGTLAGAIGLTIGVVFVSILGAPVLGDFMLGWANIYPSFQLPYFISLQTVLFCFAITIVPLLFATVIPSWVNATVDPDISMRGARA